MIMKFLCCNTLADLTPWGAVYENKIPVKYLKLRNKKDL